MTLDQSYREHVTSLIAPYKSHLTDQYDPYLNHCLRVINIAMLLNPSTFEINKSDILFALAFHDIGLYTDSFDYLAPSIRCANMNTKSSRINVNKVETIILNHHKLSLYHGEFQDVVNLIRQADLVDLTMNVFQFGIPRDDLVEITKKFPYLGFHGFLLKQFIFWFLSHPLNPLPMFKL